MNTVCAVVQDLLCRGTGSSTRQANDPLPQGRECARDGQCIPRACDASWNLWSNRRRAISSPIQEEGEARREDDEHGPVGRKDIRRDGAPARRATAHNENARRRGALRAAGAENGPRRRWPLHRKIAMTQGPKEFLP